MPVPSCTRCNNTDRSANRPEAFTFYVHENDEGEICGEYSALLLIHRALHTLYVLLDDADEARRVFDGIADLICGKEPDEVEARRGRA